MIFGCTWLYPSPAENFVVDYIEPHLTSVENHAKLREIFEKRRKIARYACKNWDDLSKMRYSSSIEELLKIHEKIFEKPEAVEFEFPPLKYSGQNKAVMFAVSHLDSPKVSEDFMICLPQKTGSSHWVKGT